MRDLDLVTYLADKNNGDDRGEGGWERREDAR